MADDPRAVLAQIRERAEKAGDELDRLTEGRGPAANWRWSIPANPERDSDLLIGASQGDMPRMARALEAVLEVLDDPGMYPATPDGSLLAAGAGAIKSNLRRAITDALTTEETKP